MTNIVKFAQQGIRQIGFPHDIKRSLLVPGDKFNHVSSGSGICEELTIPEGTIGIVHHDENTLTVSVIRDDCKAARRAIRAANEIEQLVKRAEDTYFTDEPQLRYSDLTDEQKNAIVKIPFGRPRVRNTDVANHYESGPPSEEYHDLKNEVGLSLHEQEQRNIDLWGSR